MTCLYYGTGSNCYAQYTSKEDSEHLQRNISTNLRKITKLLPHHMLQAVTKAEPIHWSKCTVCQRESPKERLSSAVVSANFGSSPGHLITMSVSDLPASVIKFQRGHSAIWHLCSLSLKETTKKVLSISWDIIYGVVVVKNYTGEHSSSSHTL